MPGRWPPQGVAVVDNSSALRLEDDVPLVVPEVNAAAIGNHKLIANPNCTTAILVVALEPLRQAFGLKRVIVSTYQAASGAGAEGMAELEQETRRVLLEGGRPGNHVFAHPLPFNVIPQIDSFQPNGYTREEMKVAWESRKIMGMPDLLVSCTAVRIPTFRVHAEAVTIETERPVTPEAARAVLAKAAGVKLVDDAGEAALPDADHRDRPGRCRGRADPGEPGLRRSRARPLPLRRPAAEGRGAERGADRGADEVRLRFSPKNRRGRRSRRRPVRHAGRGG